MRAADPDQFLVVAAQLVIAGKPGARKQFARAPRHVAAVLRPFAAESRHLLAVIDDGDPRGGELQRRCQPEQLEIALELVEGAGDVVAGEEVREQVAAAHLLTLLQIAVERHRPSASLHESEDGRWRSTAIWRS